MCEVTLLLILIELNTNFACPTAGRTIENHMEYDRSVQLFKIEETNKHER